MNFNCKLRLILFTIMTMVGLSSFGQDPTLIVIPTKIIFEEDGGSRDLAICSDAASWTMTMVGGENSDANWIKLNIGDNIISSGYSGAGNTSISISAESYSEVGEKRTTTIQISDGINYKEIYIEQYGPNPIELTISPSALSFLPKADGSKAVLVMSNDPDGWTAKSNSEWLKIEGDSIYKGQGYKMITLTADENDGFWRKATVMITDKNNHYCEVAVTQYGFEGHLAVTTTSISIDKEGDTKSFSVASNITWSATIAYEGSEKDWLTIENGSGTGDGTVTLTAGVYGGEQPRKAKVTVSGQSLSRTISVIQLGDTVNKIDYIKLEQNEEVLPVYNIQGQEEKIYIHGIYIINGKKILK